VGFIFDVLFRPVFGAALGCIFMSLIHLMVVFVTRPMGKWVDAFTHGLITNFGGNLVRFIVVIIIAFTVHFINNILNEWLEKFFSNGLFLGFFFLGNHLQPFCKRFGWISALLVAMPIAFALCFLSTVFDYSAVTSQIDVSINIFSDRTVKGAGEINYTTNIISWMLQDCVSVNNFFDYWWYSQRASIIGFRFDSVWQWALALPVNLIASVLFFRFAVLNVKKGLAGYQVDFDNDGNLVYKPSQSQVPVDNNLLLIIISFLFAVIFIINGWGWATNGSKTDFSTAIRFSDVKNVPNGKFNYGGSTTWATIRRDIDPVIQNTWPKFGLNYTNPNSSDNQTPGSGTGIRMLLDGKLAFSQSSRPLQKSEEEEARKKGIKLKQVPIALDGIAFAVNSKLKTKGLTIAQLRDIYSEKITNWSEVGGDDLDITPYSRRIEDGGTVSFMMKDIFKIEDFGENVKFVEDTTSGLKRVKNDPGAIYYASVPEVVGQCSVQPIPIGLEASKLVPPYKLPFVKQSECPRKRNQPNNEVFYSKKYPIVRRLFVIIKQNGKIEQKAGEAYANFFLTAQGQNLLSKTNFIELPGGNKCSF